MQSIKKILYLVKGNKFELPLMVTLFLFLSLIDAIGIGLVGPYVSIVTSTDISQNKLVLEFLEVSNLNIDEGELIIVISLLLIAIFLIKGLAGILTLKLIVNFSYKHQVAIRSRLMTTYQSLEYIEYIKRNSSEYIYSIQDLVSIFTGKIMMLGLKTISDIFIAIAIVAVLAWTDIQLLGILLILVGFVAYSYDFIIRKSINIYGKKANIASTRLVKNLDEAVEGMKEIRIFGKEDFFHKMLVEDAQNYANNLKKTEVLTNIPRYLIEFILITFLALMIVQEVLIGGNLQSLIPTLAMFGVASIKLIPSINSISNGIIQLRFNKNTIDLLHADMQKYQESHGKHEQSKESFQDLELIDISYSYPDSADSVIDNLSLSLKQGESIGIIGVSGSGKSTLIDLLLGLLEPDSGKINLNQNNINQNVSNWQNLVAYLPQKVFISDDSILRNITLNENMNEINHEKLMDAINRAQLTSMIDKLPNGVYSRLGEGGISISGGQRQRVALARAIYFEREVMVMDEATSALDESTEREIVKEIKRFKGDMTMIIIAHRYQTLEHCDRILKLDQGKIVGEFSYEELMEEKNFQKSGRRYE